MKFIKFIPSRGKSFSSLKPIKTAIPDWWKNGESLIDLPNGSPAPGMKACIPFMEIMNIGYCLVTPFDIYVSEGDEGNINIRWNSDPQWASFIGERDQPLGATIPRPAGHYPNGFVWSSVWGWKTPKGYSSIVTHPFNRYDLPFTTLSAVVDSDVFNAEGNIPFFVKKGFNGLIPEGTPFAQIIPIKRSKWKMWVDDSNVQKIKKQGAIVRNPETTYKKAFWKKHNGDYDV